MSEAHCAGGVFSFGGQAGAAVAAWIEDDETGRPHASLACEAPAASAATFTAAGWHATALRGSACQAVAHPAEEGVRVLRCR